MKGILADNNIHISLPVITFADPDRFLRDKAYAATTADRILEILFDIENFLGTGRLYVP
ncbi:MAG: hypothetical protein L0215_14025 [Gemmataceae bacterium]|nr:hypothetical protein [Gemmataceae bacterium]